MLNGFSAALRTLFSPADFSTSSLARPRLDAQHMRALLRDGVRVRATAAQAIARSFALQRHQDGLAPYIVFQCRKDHGDAVVADAQSWLSTPFSVGSPADEISWQVGYEDPASFRHLFKRTTGMTPGAYLKRLQVPAFAKARSE